MNEPNNHNQEPPDDHSALIQRFRATMRGQRMRGCAKNGVGCSAGCLTLLILFAAGLAPTDDWGYYRTFGAALVGFFFASVPGWIALGGLVAVIGLQIKRLLSSREIREMAADLAASNDVRAIGPLLEARELKDSKIRQIANKGLTHLLPKVGPQHQGLLNFAEMQVLHYALYSKDVDVQLAAVKALKHIGNANSTWYVAGLAGAAPNSYAFPHVDSRVREESVATLAYLNERLERQRLGRTLLRPVNAANDEQTLLRPAGGQTEQPQDQLLRPTTPDSK